MKPSQKCYEFIAKEEGEILHPYKDIAGIPTIGIGSTMYPDGKRVKMTDPPISHARAMQLLEWEVQNKANAVAAFFQKTVLTQNQFDALVSICYNCGVGLLDKSRLAYAVRKNPNDATNMPVEEMDDATAKEWFKKQQIKVVPLITYYFALWCKITVMEGGKPTKKISDSLIKRRLREALLYHSN
jgi:lysozyme